MGCRVINDVEVTIKGNEISNEELAIYLTRIQSRQNRKLIRANVIVDREHIDVNYTLEKVPFERIRRITGYLVGTTEKWNNGKRAEEKDRVKHN